MQNLLIGGSYAVAATLIWLSIIQGIIPPDQQEPIVLGFAGFGLVLALIGVLRGRREA